MDQRRWTRGILIEVAENQPVHSRGGAIQARDHGIESCLAVGNNRLERFTASESQDPPCDWHVGFSFQREPNEGHVPVSLKGSL